MIIKLFHFVLGTFLLVQYVHCNAIGIKCNTNSSAEIQNKNSTEDQVETARWEYLMTIISEVFNLYENTYNSSLNIFQPLVTNYVATENVNKTVWEEKLQNMKNLLDKVSKPGDENKSEKNTFLRQLQRIFSDFKQIKDSNINLSELDKHVVRAQENLSKEIENIFAVFSNNLIAAAEKYENTVPPREQHEEKTILETVLKIKNAADLKQKFAFLHSLLEFDDAMEKH